jgi:ACS family glucarate transporter-like MFS transporter
MPLASAPAQPTRVRHKMIVLAVLLAMITYLDRASLSAMSGDIQRDLKISKEQMGYVFSAFSLAYAAFEIPTAWWAERAGTRAVLARIVCWWSVFTMATGLVRSYGVMLATRFLFGMGEAGAWPCVARTFERWVPMKRRGSMKGIFFSGAYLSGGLTPMLVTALLPHASWRTILMGFGLLGFVWAAVWYWWFRDEPAQHKDVNAAELALIQEGRPPALTPEARRGLYMAALCLMYVPNCVTFYFCITWLPTYLREKHHLEAKELGVLAGLPLLLSAATQFIGGFSSDLITARWGLRAGRVIPGVTGYLLAAVAIYAATVVANPRVAAVCFALATASCMLTTAVAWGTCLDIGRESAATVSSVMNTAGQIGAIVTPPLVAILVGSDKNWNLPLHLLAGLFVVGALSWMLIDPRRPVIPEQKPA